MIRSPITAGLVAATPGYRLASDGFSDVGLIKGYLQFERALAEVQGALGIIPEAAAAAIARSCAFENIDLEKLQDGTAKVGYVIVPLVAALASQAGDHGQWVHYGTTSQDAMDTALALQLRDLHAPLMADLDHVSALLADLAKAHANTMMAGRSKLQHGAPISFGYRVAVWLDQVQRCRERLDQAFDACRVVQLGGAVGTLSSLGADGLRVRSALAEKLGLREPDISWHVSRDRFAEIVYCCAAVLAAMSKIAGDITFQMATEVGELREPFAEGRGSSSTMPQKRNPVICEAVIEAARAVRHLPAQMLDAMTQDQDRGIGHYYIETKALAEVSSLTAGAAQLMAELLSNLEVNTKRMHRNLSASHGLINAEAIMIALSGKIGRVAAHHLLHELCQEAELSDRTFPDILKERGIELGADFHATPCPSEISMSDAVLRRSTPATTVRVAGRRIARPRIDRA